MLEIILVITVGKYFYRLADKYKKKQVGICHSWFGSMLRNLLFQWHYIRY